MSASTAALANAAIELLRTGDMDDTDRQMVAEAIRTLQKRCQAAHDQLAADEPERFYLRVPAVEVA